LPFENSWIDCVGRDYADGTGMRQDSYFICDITNINRTANEHIQKIPPSATMSLKDTAPENNLVLLVKFELQNALGVFSKFVGSIIAQKKSDSLTFHKKYCFVSMESVSTKLAAEK
jgi:hypothetical protein